MKKTPTKPLKYNNTVAEAELSKASADFRGSIISVSFEVNPNFAKNNKPKLNDVFIFDGEEYYLANFKFHYHPYYKDVARVTFWGQTFKADKPFEEGPRNPYVVGSSNLIQ